MVVILAVLGAAESAVAGPVIFFSDMTDGPTTGFNGSSSQGAAITIWGTGFGSSRGISTLSVGGVTLTSDSSFVEWGATTNPTTARGLQRITFFLNSGMATGGTAPNTAIKVKIGGLDSNSVPFHCRPIASNHIFFVSPSGNDSNSGILTSSPWKTGAKIKRTLVAGDIAYLRAGVYTDVDPAYSTSRGAWMEIWAGNSVPNGGTAYNSIGVMSYPGELAQIGDGDINWTGNPVPETMIERMGSGSVSFNYWTFSKMKTVLATSTFIDATGAAVPWSDTGLRFVGMDIRTTSTASATGIGFVKEGGTGGSTNFFLLGNYFHHTGVPLPPANAPTLSTGTGTGLTGAYNAKYTYISWRSVGSLGQESEMSAAGTPVVLSNGALRVTWSQPSQNRQNGDPNNRAFTAVRIYRTKAGGSTYYFEKEVPIASGSTDLTTPDGSLSTRTEIEGGYYVGSMYFGGYGYSNGVYVLYNEMYRLNGTANQSYGHTPTDYIDNFHFAYNYVHDVGRCAWNSRAAVLAGGGDGASDYTYARGIYIYNNIIASNRGAGLILDTGTQDVGGGGNFYIHNNTFYANGGNAGEPDLFVGGGSSSSVVFRNNLIYSTQTNYTYYSSAWWAGGSIANLTGDHNFWYGLGSGKKPSWSTTGDIDNNTAPSFVNPNPATYADFAVQAGSMVIDAGVNTNPPVTKDFLLTSRPQGPSYDIGAHEFISGTDNTAPAPPIIRLAP